MFGFSWRWLCPEFEIAMLPQLLATTLHSRLTMASPVGVFDSSAALIRLDCLKMRCLSLGEARPVEAGLATFIEFDSQLAML